MLLAQRSREARAIDFFPAIVMSSRVEQEH